jgi:hypothetical protein
MNSLSRWRSVVTAACLLGFAVAARAADGTPPDSKALDRYLYSSLRYVINHGVDLYNRSPEDPRGPEKCYQHFRRSLEELVPVLSQHPDLQKAVKDGLDKVEKDPDWRVKMAARAQMPNPQDAPPIRQMAFALRAVFNDVRNGLNPAPPKTATPGSQKPPLPKGEGATVTGRVTLGALPLAKGTITLTGDGGPAITDAIEPDGSYTLENVPAGSYKVTIAGWKGLPAKYSAANTTPLTLIVLKGKNAHDFNLSAE